MQEKGRQEGRQQEEEEWTAQQEEQEQQEEEEQEEHQLVFCLWEQQARQDALYNHTRWPSRKCSA
jgi:hypothetical protein